MLKHKSPRQKGKLSLTKYFQEFKEGDKVAVVKDLGVIFGFSKRLQGRTGTILKKRGSAYYIEISDLGKKKRYSIKPVHLKKMQELNGVAA